MTVVLTAMLSSGFTHSGSIQVIKDLYLLSVNGTDLSATMYPDLSAVMWVCCNVSVYNMVEQTHNLDLMSETGFRPDRYYPPLADNGPPVRRAGNLHWVVLLSLGADDIPGFRGAICELSSAAPLPRRMPAAGRRHIMKHDHEKSWIE